MQGSLLEVWKEDNTSGLLKERTPHGDVESSVEILKISLWSGVWQQGVKIAKMQPEEK